MDAMRSKSAEMSKLAADRMATAKDAQNLGISTSFSTLAVASALSLILGIGSAITWINTISIRSAR